MAKSARHHADKPEAPKKTGNSLIAVDNKAFDPSLASLFASSSGPVQPPPKSRYTNAIQRHSVEESSEESSEEEEEVEGEEEDENGGSVSLDSGDGQSDSELESESDVGNDEEDAASEQSQSDNNEVLARIRESMLNGVQEKPNKKRKREGKEDVEDTYMRKLAREEVKEEEQREKKQKMETANETSDKSEASDEESFTIPKHETQMDSNANEAEELEQAARTVFVSNVSSEAIVSKSASKTLKKHFASFISDLADNNPPHKVESIRFRSTAFASAVPKKAAFAKKEIMDTTTKSTNAYVVYSTQVAAREAVRKLNGTVALGRHMHVDWVAHPTKVDHRRCVFVGNLAFVDDESNINLEENGKKKKNKPPGDVEEGLWVNFAKAGKVESVRVIRDSKTRVGKGFAYVQFEDENGVEAALQFDGQKFPPLLPRKLRVARCKPQRKDKKHSSSTAQPTATRSKGVYTAKVSEEQKSKQGRARAMLGKAGAFKSAESFVFEGHRASSKQGNSGLKLGGKKKGPNGRKSRSAAWKASGKR